VPSADPRVFNRILLAADNVPGLTEFIRERRPDLDLRAKARREIGTGDLLWAEALVGFRRPEVEGWGSVRWIHCIGAGVDGFVFRNRLPSTVLLTKSGEDFGPAIGEWCIACALAANQHHTELAAFQADRQWGSRDGALDPILLRGQRVTILGTGTVGRGIARPFRALGAVVTGLSRAGRPVPDFDRVLPAAAFSDAMIGADWLVLAAPLTEETHHYLDRRKLEQADGTYLMNVGRGALVDEAALPTALDAGWLRGAALDVFEQEPLTAESPLWTHPKVRITPHISGPSTLTGTAEGFLESLTALERGELPRLRIDPTRGY